MLIQGRPSRRVLTRRLSIHDAYGTKPFPNRSVLPLALEEAQHLLETIQEKAIKGIQRAGVKHAGE